MSDDVKTKRIFLDDGQDLTDFIVRKLRLIETSSSSYRPKILGIGGFPFMGKSILAEAVVESWGDASYILPTESVVLTRRRRLSLGIDGSSESAHKINVLARKIETIATGTSVDIDLYSWELGRHIGSEMAPILSKGGLLILDGSISTSASLIQKCDVAISLYPTDFSKWLAMAIRRDVSDRHWTRLEAEYQNRQKAKTVRIQQNDLAGTGWLYSIALSVTEDYEWVARLCP